MTSTVARAECLRHSIATCLRCLMAPLMTVATATGIGVGIEASTGFAKQNTSEFPTNLGNMTIWIAALARITSKTKPTSRGRLE
jgi:hypothetical protein